MKLSPFKILITGLLMPLSLVAQITRVSPEDQELVKKHLEKYPDEKHLSESREISFEFDFDKKTSMVTAEQHVSDMIFALKDGNRFNKAVGYDDKSEVKNVTYTEKRKTKPIYASYSDYEVNGLFYSDAKICKFTLYVTTRGERMSYDYDKIYKDVKYLTSVYFNEHYPVLNSKISFTVPEWLEVDLVEMNFEGYDITKKEETDPKTKAKTYTYEAKNLDPIKSERNAVKPAMVFPHIVVVCKKYTWDGVSHTMFSSTDDLYGWYAELCSSVGNNTDVLKPLVTDLTKDKTDDISKIESIFYWVQDNIRYIAFENGIAGFKPESVQNVHKNKYGDCKGMANLTKEMLIIAGYDARMTWLGTRGIPYDYSIPSLAVDNHAICTVFLGDEKYFLDATEEYIGLGDYARRIQGRQVLIEDGDKYILDRIPEFDCDHNKSVAKVSLELKENDLIGHYNIYYTGEESTQIMRSYNQIRSENKEESLKTFLTGNDNNISVADIKSENLDNRGEAVKFDYNVKWEHQVTSVEKETYLALDMEREFANSEFDEKRVNSFEFQNPSVTETTVEFTVPAKFKVSYLPKGIDFEHKDFSFKASYRQEGNKIVYEKVIKIKSGEINKKDFKEWNEIVGKLTKFYKDQIVLTEI